MDEGKYSLFEEKRKEKSKEVKIVFVDADNNFNVTDPEGNLKYVGKIVSEKPHLDDDCTCQSFMHGNVKVFIDSHGYAFQCKHLMKARQQRFEGYQ